MTERITVEIDQLLQSADLMPAYLISTVLPVAGAPKYILAAG